MSAPDRRRYFYVNLPAADHPLSDAEIDALFGDLLREGVEAFRSDPSYVVEMMEGHAKRIRRREQNRGYAILKREARAVEPVPEPLATRNARIVRWRETGATIAEISEEFGLSVSGVDHVLRKDAPELLKRVKSQKYCQRNERIVALRKQNLTLRQIAEIVGSNKSTVSLVLKGAGMGSHLPLEERSERDRQIREATGTVSEIARQFGISRTQIRHIRNQESEN